MRIKILLSAWLLAFLPTALAGVVRFEVEPKFTYQSVAWLGGGGGWPSVVVEKAETMGEAYSIAAQRYHDTSCHPTDEGGVFCRSAKAPVILGGTVNGLPASFYSEGSPDLGSGRAAAVQVTLGYECPTVFDASVVSKDVERTQNGSNEQITCVLYVANDDSCDDCDAQGNPVLPSTGQKIQSELDYPMAKTGLVFERVYRSTKGRFYSTLDQGWYGNVSNQGNPCYPAFWWKNRTETASHCYQVTNNPHVWQLGAGRFSMYRGEPGNLSEVSLGEYAFVAPGGSGGGYVRSRDNFLYALDSRGRVIRKMSADGRVGLSYTYSESNDPSSYSGLSGLLAQVTYRFGRALKFSYDTSNQLASMVDPASQTYRYEYCGPHRLSKVVFPDGASKTYHYEFAAQNGCAAPYGDNLLTGITDEAGHRYATYRYLCDGRASSSEHAGGVHRYSFSYYTSTPSETTVTDPLGTQRRHGFEKIGEKYWPSQVTIASPVDPAIASSQAFWRDAKGRVLQRSDSGNFTCFEYDQARGLQTSKTQGLPPGLACSTLASGQYGFPEAARRTSYQWHPVWTLPTRVAEPRKLTTYVYHGQPDPLAGGAVLRCAPASALLPDGSPIAALCKKVEQETADANGGSGFAAQLVAGGVSRTWNWTYNDAGQVLSEADPVGSVTRYAYHAATTGDATEGDLMSVTGPSGQVTRYTRYDRHGNVVEQIDPTGSVTVYARDVRQRVTRITQDGLAVAMTYQPTGLLQSIAQPSGYAVSYQYDDAQRLTGWSDNRGYAGSYTLDGMGNRINEQVQDSAGNIVHTLSRTINAVNRVASETVGGNQSTTYGYNPFGDLVSHTNGLNQATRYTFDNLRRLSTQSNPSNAQASLTYNAQDAITKATDFKSVATSYTRDALGNASQEASADSGTLTRTYDSLGLPQSLTDALGRATAITRDALGRPTQIVSSLGGASRTTVLRYDLPGPEYNASGSPSASVGSLSEIQDAGVTTRYQRDAQGRITARTQVLANGSSSTVGYQYVPGGTGSPGAGQIVRITYPSGRQLVHQYDATGQLIGLQWNGQPLVSGITWSPLGQATGWQWPGFVQTPGNLAPLAEQRSYTSAGQLAASALLQLTWDSAGRIAQITQQHMLPTQSSTVAQQVALTSAYSYDTVGRLTASAHSAPNTLTLPSGTTLSDTIGANASGYAWDANGNRSQSYYSSSTAAGTATLQRDYQLASNSNRLGNYTQTFTPAGGSAQTTNVSYNHDATGSITRKGDSYLHYGVDGRIAKAGLNADPASALAVSYTYNARGQRVFKSDARLSGANNPAITTQTVYAEDGIGSTVLGQYGSRRSSDSAAPAGEMDSTEVIYLPTANGPMPIAAQINGRLYAIDADHLNTPRRLTNTQGQVAWQWLITGFGEANPTTGATGYAQSGQGSSNYAEAIKFDLRYPGQVFDEETQLNYNLNRSYDPPSGRYFQADPIGLDGGWNRFAYVAGNPVSFYDPKGLWAVDIGGFWGAGMNFSFGYDTGVQRGFLSMQFGYGVGGGVTWSPEGGLPSGQAALVECNHDQTFIELFGKAGVSGVGSNLDVLTANVGAGVVTNKPYGGLSWFDYSFGKKWGIKAEAAGGVQITAVTRASSLGKCTCR
ncbi:DUF6531 domain-containing protein [Acidovorax sp. SUPP1855]|uniref:RHS repeat-associated core domain-containing protein n=1 Tax=Acidovorax sp. SUPP1855 TaxID=431774 RepID=UPI0023DE44F7|nr:RHS repeat-associated core domain-containing protein [Acidovorax sp. SUPP1855]GKS87502.1 DUF6531 domain-containing protein [Acidovorax sp. SUPP1855]